MFWLNQNQNQSQTCIVKKNLKYTRKYKFYRYNKEKFLLIQDKEIFLVILNKEDFLVILDNEETQDKEMAFVNHLLAKQGLTVLNNVPWGKKKHVLGITWKLSRVKWSIAYQKKNF